MPMPRKEQYFTIFLDNAVNFGHTKLFIAKSNSYPAYRRVEALWKLKLRNQVQTVCFEGVKEFMQGPFSKHLTTHGIAIQITAPYAHSQAGKAKQYIHMMEDRVQALIADAKLLPLMLLLLINISEIVYLCQHFSTVQHPMRL
jgi:hypothetical protein